MNSVATETDVLIVGAGPVGLFLANECARRGLRFRLVETRASQSEHSKALAVMPRTLEIFDMAGVADGFLEAANRVTWVALVDTSRTLARMRFSPEESPYQFVAMVPQDVTERLLVEELRRKGGAVEYETTLVSGFPRDDHVDATLNQKNGQVKISARFVVGCDGAHSAVRHLLNLPFEGEVYDALFMLADTETNETLPADEMQLCPSEFGPLAVFPMSSTRRRIVATVASAEDEAPSLDIVRRVIAQRGPGGLEALAIKWGSYFRVHHRQVANLRVGRIFVAGDAAHIHSPIGGQGMNTGLNDVWNLVWKLDLAIRGYGSERLLDSYNEERRPVIKHVIDMTDFMTRALGTPSKLAQAARNAIIPLVSRVAPFQHGIVERLSQLGIAYGGSPIVEGAGKRYFDDSLRGGNGIRGRFLLLLGSDAGSSARETAKRLCDSLSDIVELRSAPGHGITLVRPDGYVAYEQRHAAGSGRLAEVRSVLENQITLPAVGPA
jgi:2-polyprenyl-6-methoxyphenol hydroxylase-like FAD-dependent oxidoreductase